MKANLYITLLKKHLILLGAKVISESVGFKSVYMKYGYYNNDANYDQIKIRISNHVKPIMKNPGEAVELDYDVIITNDNIIIIKDCIPTVFTDLNSVKTFFNSIILLLKINTAYAKQAYKTSKERFSHVSNSLKAKINELKIENNMLKRQKEHLETKLKEVNNKSSNDEDKELVKKLKARIKTLNNNMVQASDAKTLWQTRYKDANRDLSLEKKLNQELLDRISVMENDIADIMPDLERIQILNNTIQYYSDQIINLQDELKIYQTKECEMTLYHFTFIIFIYENFNITYK